jgi:hypothetical protein
MTAEGRRAALWCALSVALVLAVYLPQLGTTFELQDDHRIIEPLLTPHPSGVTGALRMWAGALHDDVVSVGRFRPVNQIFDVIGPLALGPNALLWHACSVALAALVTLLLFHAGWMVWRSAAAASALALVTLLAPDPGPTAAWYRLGPKESWGMLFLAAALAVMVHHAGRRRAGLEMLSFALVVLTALSKEPFVLLVPTLFGVRLWLEARARDVSPAAGLRALRGVAAAYALLFAGGMAGIAYVVRSAGAHSYGGKSMTMAGGSIVRVLLRDLVFTPALAVWFVPPLLALIAFRGHVRNRFAFLLGGVVFLAWVVPQYALYATRGGFWDHYWLPCVVAFAAVNAAALAALERQRSALRGVALAVVAIWLLNAVRIDVAAVNNFKVRAGVQQAAVRVAAGNVSARSVLLIVADTTVQSEIAPAFAEFVRLNGAQARQALWVDSRCEGTACRFFEAGSDVPVPPVDPNDITAVVYLDDKHPPSPALAGLIGGGFETRLVTGRQQFFSLRHLRLAAVPFTLRVDVRRT